MSTEARGGQIPLYGLCADVVSPVNSTKSNLSFQRNLLSLSGYQKHMLTWGSDPVPATLVGTVAIAISL